MNKQKVASYSQNPNGLYAKYFIQKVVPNPDPEAGKMTFPPFFNKGTFVPDYIAVPVDPDADYFVLRLDDKQKDINHYNACRAAIHTYADAIEATIPKLAADLRERYPKNPTP